MKTNKTMLSVILFSTLFNNNATCLDMSGKEDHPMSSEYEMVKNESGVRVFTRWIPIDETRSGKEVKAELVMEGTTAVVLSVLKDDRSFTKWMGGTKDYYRVKTVDPMHWYSYVQFALPWPLKNQDIVIKYDLINEPAAGDKIIIRMTGMPSYLQSFDGVTRIPHFTGSWTITDLGNNKVMVEYIMFSNMKPPFPLWITDPIIQNNLVKTMDAFRGMINECKSDKLCLNETR